MKFGIGIPNCREGRGVPSPFGEPSKIVSLTREAERLGYDSVWADDHIVVTQRMHKEGMDLRDGTHPNWYDPLVTLAACATTTSRIQLCVGVVCVPFRDPIILAKQAATLDQMSNGRFGLGLGLGRRDEYERFNSESSKVHRGRLAVEIMEAVHRLFTEDDVTYQGEYVKFRGVSLYPKPVQSPPSIYIAGEAEDTPDRIARWATGQLMTMGARARPIPERLELLAKALENHGRKLSDIDKTIVITQNINRSHEKAVEAYKKSPLGWRSRPETFDWFVANNAIGTPEEVAEKVTKSFEMGIDHYTMHHMAVQSYQELEEQIQIFAEEVIPLVRKSAKLAKT